MFGYIYLEKMEKAKYVLDANLQLYKGLAKFLYKIRSPLSICTEL